MFLYVVTVEAGLIHEEYRQQVVFTVRAADMDRAAAEAINLATFDMKDVEAKVVSVEFVK